MSPAAARLAASPPGGPTSTTPSPTTTTGGPAAATSAAPAAATTSSSSTPAGSWSRPGPASSPGPRPPGGSTPPPPTSTRCNQRAHPPRERETGGGPAGGTAEGRNAVRHGLGQSAAAVAGARTAAVLGRQGRPAAPIGATTTAKVRQGAPSAPRPATRLPSQPRRAAARSGWPGQPAGDAWAELHCHSSYSFLDGASSPEDLVTEAAQRGLQALAITDHDGMYGVPQFAQAATRLREQAGIELGTVFGAELSLDLPGGQNGVPDPVGRHLLVLARDPEGYRRLCRVISAAQLRGGEKGRPVYSETELAQAHDGHWVVLTGCRKGAVPAALAAGGPEPAKRELRLAGRHVRPPEPRRRADQSRPARRRRAQRCPVRTGARPREPR